jgi:hypothetical protein
MYPYAFNGAMVNPTFYQPYPPIPGVAYAQGAAAKRRPHWPEPYPPFLDNPHAPAPEPPYEPPPTPLHERLRALCDQIEAKKKVPFCRPTNESCWFSAEYLIAFIRPMQFTGPLVTMGSAADALPGVIGQPGTIVLFGGDPADFGLLSGVRLTAGVFADRNNTVSLEWTGFMTLPQTQSFNIASSATGSPIIARPFFDVSTNLENAFLISRPGFFAGSVSIDNQSQMAGFEVNARLHGYWWERLHADALLGLRYARLQESLTIQDQLTPLVAGQLTFNGTAVNPPNSLQDLDSFSTLNQFIGPQIGARVGWETSRFAVSGFAKVAVGPTSERVTINGTTTLVTPTGNQTASGGVFAQPSNIGTFNRTVLGILPEFGLQLGVDVTPHVRVKLGYSFLLWNNVVRPGTEIDRNVNPGQAPGSPNFGATVGPNSPTFRFNDQMFWSHFFSVGIEGHF